jgi:hypothetical protein
MGGRVGRSSRVGKIGRVGRSARVATTGWMGRRGGGGFVDGRLRTFVDARGRIGRVLDAGGFIGSVLSLCWRGRIWGILGSLEDFLESLGG